MTGVLRLIWRNRLVCVQGGAVIVSRRGLPDDFDFTIAGDGAAFVLNPGNLVSGVEVIDDDRLRVISGGGNFVLRDDGVSTVLEREGKFDGTYPVPDDRGAGGHVKGEGV